MWVCTGAKRAASVFGVVPNPNYDHVGGRGMTCLQINGWDTEGDTN